MSWIAVASQIVAMVPALEEAAKVLAAALLTVSVAERLPQRVAATRDRQGAAGDDATDPVADRVAQVQVEDAVEAIVLVQRAEAGQVGAPEHQQVVLERIHLARLARLRLGFQFVEVAHVGREQAERPDGAYARIAQARTQRTKSVADQLNRRVEQGDHGAAGGAQTEIARRRRARIM